ncbi:MAG: efflux RND transporter permease subunit [Verrucomicrobiae bacterium]|nr:efflux RND transporter permease subunit [Verrucomicrobiae bacterium]
MLTSLVSNSLRFRVLVLALAAVLIVVGVRTLETTPLDVFPEFAPPLVEIQTEAPGLSTEEVESLITVPLENALNGTAWVTTIRSKSVLGLSAVRLLFERGTDLPTARQLVQERVATVAGQLPAVAHQPHILPPLSSTSRAMKIGIWSDKLNQMEMTDLALWTIRPRLMAISGVANVAIWGQRDRQFQVLVDPDRLLANGVTLDQVVTAAGDAATVSAGGFIDTPNQRLPVKHASSIQSPEDLGATVVKTVNGAPIRIGDVAEVVVGHPAPIGDAIINDQPGLLLIVEKQPWGNTLDVSLEVEKAMELLRPGLKDLEFDTTIFRPATFIERSLKNLGEAMWLGCAFVVIILVLFLFDWRTAAISLVAIPLSLLTAALILHYRGGTLNTMSIAGLVIAIGEVVDDAIIDVENIMRRLRLNRAAGSPLSSYQVVLKASLEVRSAVVYASLIVILVFLPVFFLGGLSGAFFQPLALSYVLAILASLLVALTVTPAMSLILLPGARERKLDAPLVRVLKAGYRRVLPRFVAMPKFAMIFILGTFVITGLSLRKLGEEFLPNFKESDFLMHWVEKPGSSIKSMDRITVAASKELRAIPGVRNFGSHIGRAEVADEVVGPNFTELWISLDEDAPYDETVAKVQEVVNGYPGLYRDLLTYLKERIKEVLSGASATIVVRIFGDDLEKLVSKAQEVSGVISSVDGATDVKVEAQVLVPQVQVRLRPEVAANFGLTSGKVRRAMATLVQGTRVGEVYENQKIVGVSVWGQEHIRNDLQALRRLPIETTLGTAVPLGDVADIEVVPAPNTIKREGSSRRIDVTCNVAGRDLGAVARDVEEQVKALNFESGYHPEFLGEFAERQASRRRLLALSALAVIGILVLLQADFQSTRLMALVAFTLPLALVGGVAGAFLTGGVLSLGSLVGFVTVLGIAARNGIMLISHYKHLQEEEGMEFGIPLVLRGAEERLAPILMTALCAALALVPLIFRGNLPGHEIEYPMAVVIVGGLVTSTLLNLFLMPPLYAAFGRRKADAVGISD